MFTRMVLFVTEMTGFADPLSVQGPLMLNPNGTVATTAFGGDDVAIGAAFAPVAMPTRPTPVNTSAVVSRRVRLFEGWMILGCSGQAVRPRSGMLSGW